MEETAAKKSFRVDLLWIVDPRGGRSLKILLWSIGSNSHSVAEDPQVVKCTFDSTDQITKHFTSLGGRRRRVAAEGSQNSEQ